MKNAGVLTSKARLSQAFGASLAAMLLVVFAGARASAQSAADTTASETWKTAAASAAASSSTSGTPSNLVPTPLDDVEATAPGTAEIPAANPASTPTASSPRISLPIRSRPRIRIRQIRATTSRATSKSRAGYRQQQVLQQFDNDGELSTPFGMQLREAKRTLKSGEDADGLLITAVQERAARRRSRISSLHSRCARRAGGCGDGWCDGSRLGRPRFLLIPVLDIMQIGESYDMVIQVETVTARDELSRLPGPHARPSAGRDHLPERRARRQTSR